jgi:hypothetical protein
LPLITAFCHFFALRSVLTVSIVKIDTPFIVLLRQHKGTIMIQINTGDHISPITGWVAIPSGLRNQLRWARSRAFVIARDMPSANTYFRTMPLGRSLSDMLNDNTIWINFEPVRNVFGVTAMGTGEMAIAKPAFDMGRWTVLATLIHELAHVDGAPGGTDKRAEEALLSCGLGRRGERTSHKDDPWTPYNPTIGG